MVETGVLAVDAAISLAAQRQHGVVTRQQLIALGLTYREIDYRLKRGLLHRVHRGVYVIGTPSPAGFASDLAAVLACGTDSYLTAGSACAAYSMIKAAPTPRQVLVVGRDPDHENIDTRTTAGLHPDDHRTWHGIPIVAPCRAVIDYARDATPDQVADAIEQGQIKNLVTKPALRAAVDRAGKRPGVPLVRDLLRDLVFTRSKAERIVLDLIRQAGLPMPLVNEDTAGDEVDFVWPELRLVLEIDGYRFHHTRRRFENDRRRDAERQREGYTVLRATYTEITTRPYSFIARLSAALARAGDRRHFLAA